MRTTKHFILFLMCFAAIKLYCQTTVPYEDRHSQIQNDTWISNAKTLSPNALRGNLHWIKYDLGDTYSIHKSKFWNLNIPSLLTAGAKTMNIDFSLDGITWYEFGRYDMAIGSGSTMYDGEDGPNFSGLIARYILINITSNYGHATNTGLAELKFFVSPATTSTADGVVENIAIKVSPNPFASNTTIELKGIESFEKLFYQITDITGKTIETKPISQTIINFDSKNMVTGVYNFTIIHPSGIKSTQLNVVK